MKNTNRRKFIKNTIVVASGAIVVPTIIPSCVRGGNGNVAPSDKVRVALVGCGNQGSNDIKNFLKDERVQVVALCDVNRRSKGYWAGGLGGRDFLFQKIRQPWRCQRATV